ncbi:Rho-binding antiterminator [Salmonella enterica subsp. arizonae]|uniref:Rho-binding antiterminator n=1 Tax=Salmonella enterica subsp. arizonae TaxID=59203 RepID=A0A379TFA5_SALER|nr:Rho-binding antiterminator [Salmonella enterica subsp. arizonae]
MSMNETYQPINCDDYDSLELACMHHLILTLTLKGWRDFAGKSERFDFA